MLRAWRSWRPPSSPRRATISRSCSSACTPKKTPRPSTRSSWHAASLSPHLTSAHASSPVYRPPGHVHPLGPLLPLQGPDHMGQTRPLSARRPEGIFIVLYLHRRAHPLEQAPTFLAFATSMRQRGAHFAGIGLGGGETGQPCGSVQDLLILIHVPQCGPCPAASRPAATTPTSLSASPAHRHPHLGPPHRQLQLLLRTAPCPAHTSLYEVAVRRNCMFSVTWTSLAGILSHEQSLPAGPIGWPDPIPRIDRLCRD
jgi:hypothetical protein